MNSSKLFSILLADDDDLILSDIQALIPWKEHGFEIVAKAHNGRQALAYYHKYHPDIVITDIIMPLLNGIDLIKKIQDDTHALNTRFLILSSYEDFYYAKSAIKLGVTDYLLKPELTVDSLSTTMRMIYSELSNRDSSRYEFNNLKLTDFFSHNRVEPYKSTSDDPLCRNKYLFILCTRVTSNGTMYSADETSHFLSRNTLDICNQIQLTTNDLAFRVDHYLVFGITSTTGLTISPSGWVQRIINYFQSIGDSCKILYTTRPLSISRFKKQYYAKRNEYQYRIFFMEGKNAESIDEYTMDTEPLLQKIVPDYADFIQLMNRDDKINLLNEMLTSVDKSYDYASFQKLMENICTYFHLNIDEEYHSIRSIQSARKWIRHVIEMEGQENKTDLSKCSTHIRNALLYINTHYIDPNLTIESIAAAVGLSSSRLSVLFKQEMGKTPLEYLTSLRVNEAIKLLRNSNLKIYEIANKVGYKSSQYFSRIFFNNTGKKPLDYRKTTYTKYTIGDE